VRSRFAVQNHQNRRRTHAKSSVAFAAEDGIVVPKVIAAARPITIARFELPIIVSFRFAFQSREGDSFAQRQLAGTPTQRSDARL
jgi:hypothetical protein